jgi:hypothetical protein
MRSMLGLHRGAAAGAAAAPLRRAVSVAATSGPLAPRGPLAPLRRAASILGVAPTATFASAASSAGPLRPRDDGVLLDARPRPRARVAARSAPGQFAAPPHGAIDEMLRQLAVEQLASEPKEYASGEWGGRGFCWGGGLEVHAVCAAARTLFCMGRRGAGAACMLPLDACMRAATCGLG